MSFDEQLWEAQRGTPALEEENPRGAMAPELLREPTHRGHDARRGPAAARAAGARGRADRRLELGRSSWGVSFEQIAVEYDGGELVRAQLRRT